MRTTRSYPPRLCLQIAAHGDDRKFLGPESDRVGMMATALQPQSGDSQPHTTHSSGRCGCPGSPVLRRAGCAVRCRTVDDVGCRSALAVLSAVLNGSHIHEVLDIGSLALVTRSTRLRAPGQHLRPHRRAQSNRARSSRHSRCIWSPRKSSAPADPGVPVDELTRPDSRQRDPCHRCAHESERGT
jgi:hypothetical protein